jgi:DNA-binding HxlR family transcriptional regulator
MPSAARTYGHFCMLAAALDRVGDRWTLLVLRDLARGPRRFTDLMERLAVITPKTLTQRLRDLEGDGLVNVDRETGRRDVWYTLTDSATDLLPALDELMLWGLRHLARKPQPGEPVHPDHLLWAMQVTLDRHKPHVGSVTWVIRIAEGGAYTIRGNDQHWTLDDSAADKPDLVISTTRQGLVDFLLTNPATRSPDTEHVHISGSPRAIKTLIAALATFPSG